MWYLDLRKYSPVLVKSTPILPWIVPKREMSRLEDNAGFVANLKKKYSGDIPGLMSWLNDHFSKTELSKGDILEHLGLVTIGSISGAMIDQSDFKTWINSASLVLPTEKFFSKPFLSMGSSRHVLLKDIQLKGVGRNNLCLDEDFYHSWGGCVSRDALKGYLGSLIGNKKSKLGSLPIIGLFIYPEKTPEEPRLAIVARDSVTFRLSQIDSNFLTETDIRVTKNHLSHFFPNARPQEMMELIFDHYLHAYSVGLIHRSPSRENLLIDGRWIDTESLDFNIQSKPVYPWIKICSVHGNLNFQPDPTQSLEVILHREVPQLHFDNWIQHLFMMCELTFEAYQALWPNEIFDLNGCFNKIFLRYFKQEDLTFWREHLAESTSFNQMNFTRTQKDSLAPLKELKKISQHFSDYKCIGHYYDVLQGGSVYTFALADEDIHGTSSRLMKKWEASFWPKDLDWKTAHAFAQNIEVVINEMFS